jgi:hypothetical protein
MGFGSGSGYAGRAEGKAGPRLARQFGEGKTLAGTAHATDREWKDIVPSGRALHVPQPHQHHDE